MGRLVIYRDSERLAEHDLSRGVIGLGRHPENDIVLDDRTLSRFHAKIMRQGQGDGARWVVVDLGAQNGVHLNGERIAEEVELKTGDRIELGRYTAVFEHSAPGPARNGGARRDSPVPKGGGAAAMPGGSAALPAPKATPPRAASPRAAAPTPAAARRGPSPADELDLDEDLRIDDNLNLDLDEELGLGGLDQLEAPTRRDPGQSPPAVSQRNLARAAAALSELEDEEPTNAQDNGLTADLVHELKDELDDDDNDDVSHAAFVPPQPTFVVLYNGMEVSRHPLAGEELVIGRSKQCDIVISLLGLSRRHARVSVTDEGIVVEDLGSQNGTWVNNVRIDGRQTLKHGDLLNFYDYGVLFLEDGNVDVGLPGSGPAPAAPGRGGAVDDVSDHETGRALAAPGRSPPAASSKASSSSPANARGAPQAPQPAAKPPLGAPSGSAVPPGAGPARAAGAGSRAASGGAAAQPPASPANATVVEVPRASPRDDEDDLGLGMRASSLVEATEFGRPRPGGRAAGPAHDNRFDPDDLGDGSFLGDEFDDGAAKDRSAPSRAPVGRGGAPSGRAPDLSQAAGDVDLEAEVAFGQGAHRGDAEDFEDLHTNGELRELGDRTSAGIGVESFQGAAGWPSDDDLDRVLAQTNDVAAVTVDVTLKGRPHAQIPLSQAVTRVGTDPRCECALAKGSGLRPWHLTFVKMGGGVVVTRANRAAMVDFGGKPIDSATLRNGDVIRCGDVEMKLRFRR